MLSYNEEQELAALYPAWRPPSQGGTTPPPQPDWYPALRAAEELQVNIFALEGLDLQEPWIRETVKGWAYMKIQAEIQAQQISLAAQRAAYAPDAP